MTNRNLAQKDKKVWPHTETLSPPDVAGARSGGDGEGAVAKESDNSQQRTGDIAIALGGGSLSVTGGNIGTVHESDPEDPEGRFVHSHPASGGASHSVTDSSGTVAASMAGDLSFGKSAETAAMDRIIEAIRQRGDIVELVLKRDEDDQRGNDAVLLVNGNRVNVQIVSLPADAQLIKTLEKSGKAELEPSDAVEVLRRSMEKKRHKANDTILVLDAAQLGAVASPNVVGAYLDRYGDPEVEYGVRELWIAGPTTRSTIRLNRGV